MKRLSVTIAALVALAIPIVSPAQDGSTVGKQLEIFLKEKDGKRRLLESFGSDDHVEQKWSSGGKGVQVFVCVYSSSAEATSVMDFARLNVADAVVKPVSGFGDEAYLTWDSRGTSAWLGIRSGKRYVVIHSSPNIAKKFARDISDYLARN